MAQPEYTPLPHSTFRATCDVCGAEWFNESSSASSLLTKLYEALRAHGIAAHGWHPPAPKPRAVA
jgi:hypothetical protein